MINKLKEIQPRIICRRNIIEGNHDARTYNSQLIFSGKNEMLANQLEALKNCMYFHSAKLNWPENR